MIVIAVPVLGRPRHLSRALASIHDHTPASYRLIVAVDGDPSVDWHHVTENERIARAAGADVLVLGAWRGNGAAFEDARRVAGAGMLAKVDADLLVPDGWLTGLLAEAEAHDDGALGSVVARVHPQSQQPAGRAQRDQVPGFGVALFTARGNAAITDHTTALPVGGHDLLIARALHEAGLWVYQSNQVTVLAHLGDRALPSDPYDQWKRAQLSTVPLRAF